MASVAAEKSITGNYVLIASSKIALVALIVANAAQFIFGVTFGVFSWNALLGLLNSGHLPSALSDLGVEASQVANFIVSLSVPPVIYATITATFPFLGVWIYLAVPQPKTTAVGLMSVLGFVTANMVANLIFHPSLLTASGLTGLVIGILIVYLYSFLAMGIGFNIAKAFKLRPQN